MDCWTEVLNENIAVTHFSDDEHRYTAVLIPLSMEIPPSEVDRAEHYVNERGAWKHTLREMSKFGDEMERQMAEREQIRDTLVEAGYDPEEVPL